MPVNQERQDINQKMQVRWLRVPVSQLKTELYAILMMLSDFQEFSNLVTDSQYTGRVVLHTETAELIQDDAELTSQFIQLQQMIRNRSCPNIKCT